MTSLRVSLRSGLTAFRALLGRTGEARGGPVRISLRSSALAGDRIVDVFLPAGYADEAATHYPVLYANDGQDMAALDLAGTMDRLGAEGSLTPPIVVALHATQRRLMDYGTGGVANAQGLGADAGRHEEFLCNEVMPLIQRRFRTRSGPDANALLGWSLGGLSAFDIAWRHSDRFGAVGVFSGAFWWRTDDRSVSAKQASRIMHRRVRETESCPRLRMWFESGHDDEAEDRDGNGVIDAIQDTEELIDELTAKGYRRGVALVHRIVDGGHNLETWRRVLPEFLTWAFPAGPAMPLTTGIT